jgi:hypothetical protein
MFLASTCSHFPAGVIIWTTGVLVGCFVGGIAWTGALVLVRGGKTGASGTIGLWIGLFETEIGTHGITAKGAVGFVRIEGDGATLFGAAEGGDPTSTGLLGLEIDAGTQAGTAAGTTTAMGIWRMVGADGVGGDSPEGGRMTATGAKGAFGVLVWNAAGAMGAFGELVVSATGATGAFGVRGGITMGAVAFVFTGSGATGGGGGASPLAI